ncbi:hypothetical protein P3TCK_07022 [Photobacterium profundum 3TCK]|uniref:Uncharacterized protein n=1 Tax=Photobacterium profundum 3TCK TaxID=314280 RepID=Q1YW80_9GAMM|nr:hypothetical protein [Photobacterium profundum]EAS40554.1 hypothetical protein P3TCK_07022 [Photobacterium profundum 3TCK]
MITDSVSERFNKAPQDAQQLPGRLTVSALALQQSLKNISLHSLR